VASGFFTMPLCAASARVAFENRLWTIAGLPRCNNGNGWHLISLPGKQFQTSPIRPSHGIFLVRG
jgi:hypothetical protein